MENETINHEQSKKRERKVARVLYACIATAIIAAAVFFIGGGNVFTHKSPPPKIISPR